MPNAARDDDDADADAGVARPAHRTRSPLDRGPRAGCRLAQARRGKLAAVRL